MILSEMGYTESRCSNCRSFVIEEEEEEEEDDFEKSEDHSTGWCKANQVWLQIDNKGRGCCEMHTEKSLAVKMVVKNYPEEETE